MTGFFYLKEPWSFKNQFSLSVAIGWGVRWQEGQEKTVVIWLEIEGIVAEPDTNVSFK